MPEQPLPIQPLENPIICNPYEKPITHWLYDKKTGAATQAGFRRDAGYWYKTDKTGSSQQALFTEEERDDLPLVNALRREVERWREAQYHGGTEVTKTLLKHWAAKDRPRRLFFCQREAVETIIYLAEIRIPGRSGRTGFRKFDLTEDDLRRLLRAERPSFATGPSDFFPVLIDADPNQPDALPLRRLGCKMATGSGKTVVMAMLVSWAFCNRGVNPGSKEFPSAVLVNCPNLTVKERLQVLRPENPENYYAAFDLVPLKYRPLMQSGKVLVENWHHFNPESEHKEGDRSYIVVDKGPETPETFARRILGDLYDRMPVMVLNDEGHHCWRPAPVPEEEKLSSDERKEVEGEAEEAKVWLDGLDRLNNAGPEGKSGIAFCVDLSATPFYIKGSGHPEGRPFPWLVCDFGLVDAIESGIVKIPRLPVLDTTGRPDPKYFKLWERIRESLQPAEFQPGKARRPKPEVVYREAEAALKQIAGQWVQRFHYIEQAQPGQEQVPPVLIVVCDNTEIAEVFFRNISGERDEEVPVRDDLDEDDESDEPSPARKPSKERRRVIYEEGTVFPQYFSNTPSRKRTIRIDTRLLAEAESEDPNKRKRDLAEELRRVVATVGKRGLPGEHVRCVVSVSMLTEGWDANNVTHILGLRAFGSQLLCEQVVGRGLRRMDYQPDPETGLLTPEYVDVYGIPFSVIPYKGRPVTQSSPEDKPKQHVQALPERAAFEMRFPVVEGFVFALEKGLIRCDVDSVDVLMIEPNLEPTATFVQPTIGYREGHASQAASPVTFTEQNRQEYYKQTDFHAILFQATRAIMDDLIRGQGDPAFRVQSRHQLFPQLYSIVCEYAERKVDFRGEDKRELGLEKYFRKLVERLRTRIEPDNRAGESPLLPVLPRYKPIGTTADVDFKTVRPCFLTNRSHINQVVTDTMTWESSAAFRLEQSKAVSFYARNDHLGLLIPYEYLGIDHSYEPDYLVRLRTDVTVILEIKGYESDQDKAKHNAAKRWVSAVNNWGRLGGWDFHVCRDPQLLHKEMEHLDREATKQKPRI